jgi:serine/threonine protein phosphatase PrpC
MSPKEEWLEHFFELDPVQIMSKALNKSKSCGSATCVICVGDRKNLIVANLGGFRLYDNPI